MRLAMLAVDNVFRDVHAKHAEAQVVIRQKQEERKQQQKRASTLNKLMAAHELKAHTLIEAYKPSKLPREGDSVLYAKQVAEWLNPPPKVAGRAPLGVAFGGFYAARSPAATQAVEYLPIGALQAASEPGMLVCAIVNRVFEQAGETAVAAAHLCELGGADLCELGGAGGAQSPPTQPVSCDPRQLIRIHPDAYEAFPFRMAPRRLQPCPKCLDAVGAQLEQLIEDATPLADVLRQQRDAVHNPPVGTQYLLQTVRMDNAQIAAEGVKALERGQAANFNSIERCMCAHGHLRPQVPIASVAVVAGHQLDMVRRWWPATPTEAIEDLNSEEPCRRCEEELRRADGPGPPTNNEPRRRNDMRGNSSCADAMTDFIVQDSDGDSGGDGGDDPLASAVRSLAPVSKIDALLGAVSASPACERQLNIARQAFEVFKESFENLPRPAKQPLEPTWLGDSAGEATDQADIFAVGDTGLVWVWALANGTPTWHWRLSETNFQPGASVWAHATRNSLPLKLRKRWLSAAVAALAESGDDDDDDDDAATTTTLNGVGGRFLSGGTFLHGVVAQGASAKHMQVNVSHGKDLHDIAMNTSELMASPLFILPSGVHLAPPPNVVLKAGIGCNPRIALANQYVLVDYASDGWWIGHVQTLVAADSIVQNGTKARKVQLARLPQPKPSSESGP